MVQSEQSQTADQDGDADDGTRCPIAAAEEMCGAGRIEPWYDQREGTGRKHHASAEAKQRVLYPSRWPLRQQHRQGSQRSGQCRDCSAEQGGLCRWLALKRSPHLPAQRQQADCTNGQSDPDPQAW
ncbi:hypothetical protein D3C72_1918850 [compost metagenome]